MLSPSSDLRGIFCLGAVLNSLKTFCAEQQLAAASVLGRGTPEESYPYSGEISGDPVFWDF